MTGTLIVDSTGKHILRFGATVVTTQGRVVWIAAGGGKLIDSITVERAGSELEATETVELLLFVAILSVVS